MDISKDLNCLVCFNKSGLICSNSTKSPVIPGFVIHIFKGKGTTPLSTKVFSQPDLLAHSPAQRQENGIFSDLIN